MALVWKNTFVYAVAHFGITKGGTAGAHCGAYRTRHCSGFAVYACLGEVLYFPIGGVSGAHLGAYRNRHWDYFVLCVKHHEAAKTARNMATYLRGFARAAICF